MGYNRINLLTKVAEIQDIVLEHKKKGSTQIWIYKNIIQQRYFISYDTFNKYLSIPAKSKLKALRENSSNH